MEKQLPIEQQAMEGTDISPLRLAMCINRGMSALESGDLSLAQDLLLSGLTAVRGLLAKFPSREQQHRHQDPSAETPPSMSADGNGCIVTTQCPIHIRNMTNGNTSNRGQGVADASGSGSTCTHNSNDRNRQPCRSQDQRYGCPSSYLYTQAQSIDMESVRDLQWSFSTVNAITAILTYDVALLYHIKTILVMMQQPQRNILLALKANPACARMLEQTKLLYMDAYQLTVSTDAQSQDILRILGIWNNLAQIHCCLGDELASTLCCHQVLQVIAMTRDGDEASVPSKGNDSSRNAEYLRAVLMQNLPQVELLLENAVKLCDSISNSVAPAA